MQPFGLTLPDDTIISGLTSFPTASSTSSKFIPLLVCLHGGSYAADYYDADEEKSIGTVSKPFGVPVISINRQGYKSSTPITPPSEGQSSLQEQAKRLHNVILPALWEKYGAESGASSVVVIGHSVGGSIATLVAALYATSSARPSYPLSGLCVSGIGDAWHPYFQKAGPPPVVPDESGQHILWPDEVRDAMLLMIPDGRAEQSFSKRHAELNYPAPIHEVMDSMSAESGWASYWKGFAKEITVPVMSVVGEYDGLWDTSKAAIDVFAAAYEKTIVERSIVTEGPHCIELSYQGRAVLIKFVGFAIECAVAHGLMAEKKSSDA